MWGSERLPMLQRQWGRALSLLLLGALTLCCYVQECLLRLKQIQIHIARSPLR